MPDVLMAPADAEARDAALDISRSVIVQAPAGSGKTDLLTRRFMRLLTVVDEPEEILAITFTRAATAEMRGRILNDLATVAHKKKFRPEDISRIDLARQALGHAERRGWKLLEQPQRLTIETIDSLCLRIAHDQPLLARLGGKLQPTEQADALYADAARRTLERLGGPDAALDEALAHVLDLRDNRLSECQSLLADMLRTRDQWQHAFPLSGEMTEEDWTEARTRLELPFHREVRRVLAEAYRLLNRQSSIAEHLLSLAHYACSQGNRRLSLLAGIERLSPAMSLEHWRCISDFLLTGDGEWRRAVDKRHGFPSSDRESRQRKTSMLEVLQWLHHVPHLRETLCALRDLPPVRYSEEQWRTLRHVFTVLRQAIAELRVFFAQQNRVDFTEIALAALHSLSQNPERAAALGENIRHLLIDEFQDTSRRQHELVSALLSAWEATPDSATDGRRTVFLVGDPMQSIYMFRQAEVELFTHVRDHGIGADGNCVRCEPVQLSVNFRTHEGLVEPLNEMFRNISEQPGPPGSASVAFAESKAWAAAQPGQALHIYPQVIGSADTRPTREEKEQAQDQEARQVLEILRAQLPLIRQTEADGGEYRVAVLVRARTHLAQLVPMLRRNQIPFRAVEIEKLSDRQEMLDLLSLTRALLHPMDRPAWLSVLRAPWCGLTLSDLHRLMGSDDPRFRDYSVPELMREHEHLLSPEGQQRLRRSAEIIRGALDLRWRQSQSPSIASWVERTWRTLGGPACVDAAGYENMQVFFSLLDGIAADGLALSSGDFDAQFERLFAQPDPSVSDKCGIQLMTIHKSKGLGFEVVILPGLERKSSGDSHPLVCSLERRSPWNSADDEFLVAPIGLKGDDTDPLYRWVTLQRKIRLDEERQRLFYVACTRARRELHLLGTAVASESGVRPENSSLLETAWPALHAQFEAKLQRQSVPVARVLPFPPLPGEVQQMAAAAESSFILRRLPLDFDVRQGAANVLSSRGGATGASVQPLFRRREGSRQARLIGTTVHVLLQRLGPCLATVDAEQIRTRAASLLRASALMGEALASATDRVTKLLLSCAADPVCQWIVAAHPGAQSEAAWSSLAPEASGSRLRTIRADRIFRAGAEPGADGEDYLWIIDYKTAAAPAAERGSFLAAEREVYGPQLAAYGRALRGFYGADTPLRLGLYYPALGVLDYWDPDGA